MWIYTKFGMVSAVQDDNDFIVVRARIRKHLTTILDEFNRENGDQTRGRAIITTPGADYRFRVLLYRTEFADLLAWLAHQVDYDNFKTAACKHDTDGLYCESLHRTWQIAVDLQRRARPPAK